MQDLTAELLQQLTHSTATDAERCLDPIKKALDKYDIDTAQRVAAFLATIAVESMNLSHFEEGLYYKDPVRVATIFKRAFDLNHDGKLSQAEIDSAAKYCKNPRGLSQILYQGYHGRGPIQITWKKNYQAFESDTGNKCVDNPDALLDLPMGFESAGWFWYVNGCNAAADAGSMHDVTKIVNGPALLALAERTSFYNAALQALQ